MIAIVNQQIQSDLKEMMGAEDFEGLLLDAATQFRERAKALEAAIDCKEWEGVRSMAHKIKGSMGSLGYDALFLVLDELEKKLLVTPDEAPDNVLIDSLKTIISATERALPLL